MRNAYAGFVAALGAFALVTQFVLSYQLSVAGGRGLGWTLFVYFGFFTILTNLFAVVTLASPLVSPRSRVGRVFTRPGVVTTAAASIALVGITYSLVLRRIWNPEGLQLVVDHILHDVTPPLFLVFWFVAVPRGAIRLRDVPTWLVYPFAYFAYVIVRGEFGGHYPYPFVDVSKLGYGRVFVNATAITLAYAAFCFLLVGVNRLKRPAPAGI